MKYPQDFIERVSEGNNLVDIISQYTQLKPSGGGLMGRCPFPDHPEKTPSFSVSESKQVYNCFGCHKKGNIFSFLQTYNGMSFKEAVEYLAERAQIPIPHLSEQANTQADLQNEKKKSIYRANSVAQTHFVQNFEKLLLDHPVRNYVQKRGLTPEILQIFKIGYSTEDWDSLVQVFERQSISLKIGEEARLIKARTGGKVGYFDIFRERLMFPIFSIMGEVLGFGGRIITQGEPKYLNSPETPVFHKGKILYGLFETAKYIRSEDQAIIVEGYMDLISLYSAGIKNVAATMGTALTLDHGRILSRMTKNVLVLFDGDAAGQEASERSLPILLAADVYPKGLVLPNNQDPDDYVRENGSDSLLRLASEAKDLFSMILDSWLKGYRGEASEKVRIVSRLEPIFAQIKDSRLKQLYLKETALKLNVEERWLYQSLNLNKKTDSSSPSFGNYSQRSGAKLASQAVLQNSSKLGVDLRMQNPHQGNEAVTEESQLINLAGISMAERVLLGLILRSLENFLLFEKFSSIEDISHAGLQKLLKRITEVSRQAPEKFDKLMSLLTNYVRQPEYLIADQGFVNDGSFDSNKENQMVLDCVRKIKEKRNLEQRQQITQEMKRAVPGTEAYQAMMKILMDLKKEELQLKNNEWVNSTTSNASRDSQSEALMNSDESEGILGQSYNKLPI